MTRARRRDLQRPWSTALIVTVCITVFVWDLSQGAELASGRNSVAVGELALSAEAIELNGQWYRIVTGAFTHSGLMHVGFNMWILWQAGRVIEGRFGALTLASIYGTGVFGGALGALLMEPSARVVGASGAVFALIGALVVVQHMAGIPVFSSGLGRLLLLNVGLSFLPSISMGSHFGGLAVGLVSGVIIGHAHRRGSRALALAPLIIATIGMVCLLLLVPAVARAAAFS